MDFFVGENGTDNNQLCTAKNVAALGDVRGACPGAPRLSGTYLSRRPRPLGAHPRHPRASRASRMSPRAPSPCCPRRPQLVIPVPGTRAQGFHPACVPQSHNPSPDGNCAIVDFKIIEQDIEAGTGTAYVNWEDSEQGGDYDQDMKGTLELYGSTPLRTPSR